MRISTNEFLLGSLGSILSQESTANKLNQQIASGQAIQTPMDNPAGAGTSLSVANQIDRLTYDSANADASTQSIQAGLNALQGVNDLITQIREAAVQAANGTMNNSDRAALAGTVNSARQQMIQFANAQSPDGQYMFGGSQTGSAPFTLRPNGQIDFTGDNASNSIEIAPSLSVPISISGQNIFMNIPSGNGSFSVAASDTNTGAALAVPGGVTSASQLLAEHLASTEFQVTFGSANPNGSVNYTVTSGTGSPGSSGFAATSGVVSSGSYTSGSALGVGGVTLTFKGTPANGDQYTVATSQNTSLFQIVQNLSSALTAPGQGQSTSPAVQQQIENALSELDSAQTSVLAAQATLGGNLSDIQSVQSRDATANTTAQEQLSNLQSVNLPQVMTNYNETIVSLQAAETAFARIQNLSLFSLIHG